MGPPEAHAELADLGEVVGFAICLAGCGRTGFSCDVRAGGKTVQSLSDALLGGVAACGCSGSRPAT